MLNFDISFSYYKQDYLFWNAKLKIEKGLKLLLVGNIGVGKTTLLEIIAGLNKNWQGTINGINNKDFKQNYKISYFPSSSVLFEKKSVYKNLEYACKVCGVKKPYDIYIEQAMKEFNLEKLKDIKVINLSYVEKQKLAFARSYIKNPDIILIDDLFLDIRTENEANELSKLIERFLNGDKIVIVATTGYVNYNWNYNKIAAIKNNKINYYSSLDKFCDDNDIEIINKLEYAK